MEEPRHLRDIRHIGRRRGDGVHNGLAEVPTFLTSRFLGERRTHPGAVDGGVGSAESHPRSPTPRHHVAGPEPPRRAAGVELLRIMQRLAIGRTSVTIASARRPALLALAWVSVRVRATC